MKEKKTTPQQRKRFDDIILYVSIIILIIVGFVMGFQLAKIAFWGLVGVEAILLGLNWIMIIFAPHMVRAEIGAETIKRIGMLRTTNYAINMIFKIPMILGLIMLSQFFAALTLISTIFFEEHRVVLIEKSLFVVKNKK